MTRCHARTCVWSINRYISWAGHNCISIECGLPFGWKLAVAIHYTISRQQGRWSYSRSNLDRIDNEAIHQITCFQACWHMFTCFQVYRVILAIFAYGGWVIHCQNCWVLRQASADWTGYTRINPANHLCMFFKWARAWCAVSTALILLSAHYISRLPSQHCLFCLRHNTSLSMSAKQYKCTFAHQICLPQTCLASFLVDICTWIDCFSQCHLIWDRMCPHPICADDAWLCQPVVLLLNSVLEVLDVNWHE